MDNFTPIRNGLLDHALAGKLSPFDFGLYVFLIMRADWSTGICQTCALTIACQFGDSSLKKHIQKALSRLRDRHYINYRNGDGSRGAYPVLINKFSVTVGGLSGTRLNAWKHNGLVKPEYEPQNGDGAVVGQSCGGRAAVVGPNEDLRLKDVQDLKTEDKKETSSSELKSSSDMMLGRISEEGNDLKAGKNPVSREDPIGKEAKPKHIPSAEAVELAALLKSLILENNPRAVLRDKKWALEAGRMMRIDKRTPDEIRELIVWSQHDKFWHRNILSMDKLREKFDRLTLERRNGSNGHGYNKAEQRTQSNLAALNKAFPVDR